MLPRTLPPVVGDVAIVVARLLLGVVLIAHGWGKFFGAGIARTGQAFEALGIPLPTVAAVYAATVEVVGGALLIVGAFTAVVGVLVVLDMLGAAFFVHISQGILIMKQGDTIKTGWELVGMVAAAALLLAAYGAGRFSVDALLARRKLGRHGVTV